MENSKPKVQSILESVFTGAIDKLSKQGGGCLINALLVQLDMMSGEVLVYDDNEILLEKNIIFEWVEQPPERSARLYRQALHFIRVVLAA